MTVVVVLLSRSTSSQGVNPVKSNTVNLEFGVDIFVYNHISPQPKSSSNRQMKSNIDVVTNCYYTKEDLISEISLQSEAKFGPPRREQWSRSWMRNGSAIGMQRLLAGAILTYGTRKFTNYTLC